MNKFSHIVSLGYNCEVSYRIMDYMGEKIESYPLSWAYMIEQNRIVEIFDHMDKLYNGNLIARSDGMFLVEELNLALHTTIDHSNIKNFSMQELEQFHENGEREIRERFRYLVSKWERLLKSDEATLFLLKIQQNDIAFLKDIEIWMQNNYISNNFFIVCVTCDDSLAQQIMKMNLTHIGGANIRGFATDDNTQFGGDINGWLTAIGYFDNMTEGSSLFIDISKVEGTSKSENINRAGLQFEELKRWCDELTQARDWLVEQCKCKDEKIDSLEKEREVFLEKIATLESENAKLKADEGVGKEIDNLEVELSKYKYKLRKLEENPQIKKIIEKKGIYS